jgi:mannose-6-phosphate isomerase-like protein (cupin superfamily)
MDLDSAILYTNDISKIRKFYERTIGLEFEYQDGDVFVSFVFPNGGKLGINKSILTDREKPGGQTLFIRVSDAAKHYEKYKSEGFAFYEPFRKYDWGAYFAILDPDGNKVGFIQPSDLPRSAKYSRSDTELIDLGPTKKIYKYPSPTRSLDIGIMVLNGRHPESGFVVEHDCEFVMYVTKGEGTFYVGDSIYKVKPGDAVFVPTDHKFAADGNFEYITVDSPAYYPGQTESISD